MENLIPGGGYFLKYLLKGYKAGASPPAKKGSQKSIIKYNS